MKTAAKSVSNEISHDLRRFRTNIRNRFFILPMCIYRILDIMKKIYWCQRKLWKGGYTMSIIRDLKLDENGLFAEGKFDSKSLDV